MDTSVKRYKDNPTIDLYSEILRAYDYFNNRLFGRKLPDCIITLQRTPRTMGYVSYQRWLNVNIGNEKVDELAINPEYWMGWPITEVLSTLVHEQCHVWQREYGKPGRGRYHNQRWADKMKSVGLMPSSTGRPGGKETGDCVKHYIMADKKFHKALVELLATGFGLPWLDTQPEACGEPVKIFDSDGKQYDLDGEIVSIDKGVSENQLLPKDESGAVIPFEAKVPTPHRKKTRLKYSCSCRVNVWGKPNLSIICGDCKSAFEPEEEPAS